MKSIVNVNMGFKALTLSNRLLLSSFLLFAFLGIIQNYNDLYRAIFFVGTIPATIMLLFREGYWGKIKHSGLFWLVIALLTSLYLSVFWSDAENFRKTAIRHSRWYLWTVIFFTAMFLYGYLNLHKTKLHGLALQLTVIIGASTAITMYVIEARFPARITGQGMLDQIIMSSSLLIMLWVISLSGLNFSKRKELAIAAIGLLIITAYAFLNQSRAPLGVTIFAWAFFIFIIIKPVKTKILVLTLASGTGLFLLWYFDLYLLLERMFNRGSSYRLDIWQVAYRTSQEFFLTGYGLATPMQDTSVVAAFQSEINHNFSHAHNLFLNILIQGGIVPCTLLLCTFSALLWLPLKKTGIDRSTSMLCIIALWGLCFTDTFKIIASPQEIWLLLWAPIGILCGLLSADHKSKELIS